MRWLLRVAFVTLVAGLATPVAVAEAATITIEPSSQHATFSSYQGWPSATSTGTVRPILPIGTAEGNIYRSALRFDLSAIPAWSQVTRATLKLYWQGKCFLGIYWPEALTERHCTTHEIDVHRLLGPWSPTSTSSELIMEEQRLASVVVARFEPARWLSFDVTAAVDRSVNGSANRGFILKRSDEQAPYSSTGGISPPSATDPDPALRPKLEVTYEPRTDGAIFLRLASDESAVAAWAAGYGLSVRDLASEWTAETGETLSAAADSFNGVSGYGTALEQTLSETQSEVQADPDVPAGDKALLASALQSVRAGNVPVIRITASGSPESFSTMAMDPNVSTLYTYAEDSLAPDPGPDPECDPASDPMCTDEPGGAGASAASTGRCGAPYWPYRGKIKTGPSEARPNDFRFVYQSFIWGATRLGNLQACERGAYEHEAVYDNYDGKHYLGSDADECLPTENCTVVARKGFASNIPAVYRDTRFLDDPEERQFTVGTADPSQLVPEKGYYYWIRSKITRWSTDRGKVTGQRGYKRYSGAKGKICRFQRWARRNPTWCIFPRNTTFLLGSPPPETDPTKIWPHSVPGTSTWAK